MAWLWKYLGYKRPSGGIPGCEDDAPTIRVPRGETAKRVTVVFPYYEQPPLLERQIETWRSYPSSVKQSLEAIIVDDASPDHPARNVLANQGLPFPVRLYRMSEKVRWNQHAARNVGMHNAGEGFCLILDMDLIASADTMLGLVFGEHYPSYIYRFSRRRSNGEKIGPHANAWFMTRETFWRVGGYDETFAGLWGTDDDWRRRCAQTTTIRILAEELICHDATTKSQRQLREDRHVKNRIVASRGPDWRPKTLSFGYRQVSL